MKISLEIRPNHFEKVDKGTIEELAELFEDPFCLYLDSLYKDEYGVYHPVFSAHDMQVLWENS